MNITLVITNSRRKNLVFVSSEGKPLQLKDAIVAAMHGTIKGVYPVRKKAGIYLRTKPSIQKKNELETLSITGKTLVAYAQDARRVRSTASMKLYIKLYAASLVGLRSYILPVGQPKALRVPIVVVEEKFIEHKKHILSAAKEFSIDPTMLGAILIDEIARFLPFEGIIEVLGGDIVGVNVSVGVAQVKIDTAHDLIRKGIYHPNKKDTRLPYDSLTNTGRKHLYDYLVQPKHNVRFAAAFIRHVIDFWSPYTDLSNRVDVIGTLYHQGYGKPKENPKVNERGIQIANEFYLLAKRWLV